MLTSEEEQGVGVPHSSGVKHNQHQEKFIHKKGVHSGQMKKTKYLWMGGMKSSDKQWYILISVAKQTIINSPCEHQTKIFFPVRFQSLVLIGSQATWSTEDAASQQKLGLQIIKSKAWIIILILILNYFIFIFIKCVYECLCVGLCMWVRGSWGPGESSRSPGAGVSGLSHLASGHLM